ncbi:Esterase B1 [Pseudolycoriella hygida]|uniref:Carboxylic ester hydrolase n=1 Tax=Pseudolycoriella hygida TaxID=35572 RepID=A0A9Q0S3H5_9DIPT|nr:Esterase B1 [Pseudolycoriella hygida]
MSFIAETEYGQVRGVKTASALEYEYISFYGIPYGTPPIGNLRFKDPIPATKWTEIFDATKERPSCFSMDSSLKKVVGTENCLNLNIYTKNLKPNKLYPVMFYIFGGGFNTGSNSTALYGPDYLLMSDVVVVVCDYRLGPFGFMYFKDPSVDVPGNAGLKDQLLALKFVKTNIQNFGGDPDNITLFGHSAGAVSVNLHCISEQSRGEIPNSNYKLNLLTFSEGLFNRAILLSGSVFHPPPPMLEAKDFPYRLAKKLGFTGREEDRDVIEFLQSADPIRLAEEQNKIILPEESAYIFSAFIPHVEPFKTDRTFISTNPAESSRSAWGNDIDILVELTADEGYAYLTAINRDPTTLSKLDLDTAIPFQLNVTDKEKRLEIVRRMREVYYGESDPCENKNAFCEWQGDLMFRHHVTRLIRSRQNSNGKGKTFFCRFAVESPTMNEFRLKRNRPNVLQVIHADEVSYYFKHNFGPMPDRQSMEFTAIRRLVSLMTSFATSGNPNDNILNVDLQNVEWLPVDTKEPPFKLLNIGEDLEFKIQPEAERLLFWDKLYEETNTPLY